MGLARAASQGQVGRGHAVAATTSTAMREEADAICCRFAAKNSENSRGRWRNGLDRLASHQLEQIPINLTLSFQVALRDEAISTDRALSGPRSRPRGSSPRVAMTIGVSDALRAGSDRKLFRNSQRNSQLLVVVLQ